MFTYLVVDPTSKKFYVGSTKSLETRRPWKHLDGGSHNPRVSAITSKRNCFVFVSSDDGLDTREEEKFYLDFYYGSRWCLNNSPETIGGDNGAIRRFNQTDRAKQILQERNRDREFIKSNSEKKRKTLAGRRPTKETTEKAKVAYAKLKGNPWWSETKRMGQRSSVLSRVGYGGVYPSSKEHRLCLSADFVNYYTHFGKWP